MAVLKPSSHQALRRYEFQRFGNPLTPSEQPFHYILLAISFVGTNVIRLILAKKYPVLHVAFAKHSA